MGCPRVGSAAEFPAGWGVPDSGTGDEEGGVEEEGDVDVEEEEEVEDAICRRGQRVQKYAERVEMRRRRGEDCVGGDRGGPAAHFMARQLRDVPRRVEQRKHHVSVAEIW